MKHTLIAVSAAIALACLAGCEHTVAGAQKDLGSLAGKLIPAGPAAEPTPTPAPGTAFAGLGTPKVYKTLEK